MAAFATFASTLILLGAAYYAATRFAPACMCGGFARTRVGQRRHRGTKGGGKALRVPTSGEERELGRHRHQPAQAVDYAEEEAGGEGAWSAMAWPPEELETRPQPVAFAQPLD